MLRDSMNRGMPIEERPITIPEERCISISNPLKMKGFTKTRIACASEGFSSVVSSRHGYIFGTEVLK